MRRGVLVVLLLSGVLQSAARADTTTLPSSPPAPSAPAPAAAEPSAPADTASDEDPIESFNRKIFWFNDHLDMYVLEPTAKGWDFIMPLRVETSIKNFFWNLLFPIVTVNDLLQWKPRYAGIAVGRFAINTTVGVAGLFDPATGWGFEAHWEDFGQTLGWWGLGSGPYLVLPILGPSSVRDGAGLIVDYPLAITPFFVEWYYLTGARAIEIVNLRALYLDTIRNAKESSFDYYSFVRNAYLQRRAGLVKDQEAAPAGTDDSLYHPDETN